MADGFPATDATDPSIAPALSPLGRLRRVLKSLAWVWFGFFCLVFFTFLKLPETRIKNFVQGSLSAALADQGISISASEASFHLGFGISYRMRDVTLRFPPPAQPSRIDEIEFSPAIISTLLGNVGGNLKVRNGDGRMSVSFAASTSKKNPEIAASFSAKSMDLGKLGVFGMAGIKGSAVVSGDGSLSGDLSSPASWTGKIDLALSKVVIDQQTIQFFTVPRLSISEGAASVNISQGKATIGALKLGRPGSSDDITLNATGDVLLGKSWPASTLNLKTKFGLSESVHKAFVILDAFLGPGKTSDGNYAFNLSGPILSPVPTPAESK